MTNKPVNPAMAALTNTINRAIANGSPAIAGIPNDATACAKIFTLRGYDFYRDDARGWNAVRYGEKAPTHCGYASPEAIGRLKGLDMNMAFAVYPDDETAACVKVRGVWYGKDDLSGMPGYEFYAMSQIAQALPDDAQEAQALEAAEKRLFNCCANGSAPDWSAYDHLEISACRNESDIPDETDTQQCGIRAAEFFTVYGRLKPMNDGVMLADAITDIVDTADVLPVAVELMRRSGLPCSLAKWMTQEN